jgi:leader peptidase (prepilin peptidase)/N-methyltransferase
MNLRAGPMSALESCFRLTHLTSRFELRRWEVGVCAILGIAAAGALAVVTTAVTAVATGYLVFTMLLVTIIDSRHYVIPDVLSLPAIPIGLLAASWTLPDSIETILFDQILAAFVSSSTLFVIRILYRRLRGAEGLGLGDVKLAAAAGAWVGLQALPMTGLLATGAALITILVSNATKRKASIGLKTAIPFGSFIAPAIIVVWGFRLLAE